MQMGDSSLYFMRARFYDSLSGRFLSRDPLPQTDPRIINPYSYAAGNPVGFIDPSGMAPVEAQAVLPLITRYYFGKKHDTGYVISSSSVDVYSDRAAREAQQAAARIKQRQDALERAGSQVLVLPGSNHIVIHYYQPPPVVVVPPRPIDVQPIILLPPRSFGRDITTEGLRP